MKNYIIAGIIALTFASSQGVVNQMDKGSINYSDRTISAIGIGFVPINAVNAGMARRLALRTAKQDALRQLIEIVNGVTLTSETTMSNAMVDDVISTKVQGFIRGARQIGDPKYLSDTSIEVEYSVPMSGISDIILPPANTAVASSLPSAGGAAPAPTSGAITGVIIDARGLNARPAMAPQILDQQGSAVYGPGKYSREYGVTNGVVGYSKTLEAAQKDPRVMGNPLILKGISTAGANRTDITISNADVSKLDGANRSYNVLQDCRVLILLD